ncbi:hypothetical protein ACQLRO_005961 [Pseudomonas aeruginosa]
MILRKSNSEVPIAQSNAGSGSAEQEGVSAHKEKSKTSATFRWIAAIDAWKRQYKHLKYRFSLPLLRRVIAVERKQASTMVPLADVPTALLERSLLAHYFILLFTVPASLWAAYITLKGLSAGIRFDVWFNAWLIQGIPLLIFCVMKALTSNKTRKLILSELSIRHQETIKG